MIKMAQISLHWYPIYDQNSWKTILFGAAHTYIAHIREYPSRLGEKSTRQFRTRFSLAIQRTRKSRKWTYLTWDSFVFSLNKSLDYSLLRTDCYNILPIQNRCYKNPDKPWGFLPTHQNSFKYNFSLNAFLGTQIFLIFMTDSFFTLDPILNRFVLWKIHARSSRRARHSEFYIWAKIEMCMIFIGREWSETWFKTNKGS